MQPKEQILPILVAGAVIALAIALTIGLLANSLFWGTFTFLILFGGFFGQGITKIPADPPHVGVLTIWGEKQPGKENVFEEGFNFLPLRGLWYGAIPIKVAKVDIDLKPLKIRTPDMAESEVRLDYTFTPDPDHLVEYIESGKEQGVEKIIDGPLAERLRQWASSPTEGPHDWKALISAHDQATLILLREIGGLNPLPADATEEQRRERDAMLERVRKGNGALPLPTLGIVLNRLNMAEIHPLGKLAEAAELAAKERSEQEGEIVELDHIRARLQELIQMGYSKEAALEIVQTERGKVAKTIREEKLNISPETRAMVEKLMEAFFGRKGGQP